MKQSFFSILFVLAFSLALGGCDLLSPKSEGPNDLGGSTDLELTKVGSTFPVSLNVDGGNPLFYGVKDSIFITKNEGGIVTFDATMKFDSAVLKAIDTLAGTQDLPYAAKMAVLDIYLAHYHAKIDTTDKENMTLKFTLLTKVTSDGIQEYFSGDNNLSKPFTIVKYGASVGDKYEFTTSDGIKITRTVNYKSTTDDFPVGFWLLKVIDVVETKEDPMVQTITYHTNHKYGLVGIELLLKNGKGAKLTVFPPTL
ncbi:MAG: hypothetical protein HQ472_02495 [Ignavibacteria bacterium]|nr:hypothetical protein [Ignavibacteria bacterium]